MDAFWATSIIEDYAMDIPEPSRSWNRAILKEYSYRKAAIAELLDRFDNNPTAEASELLYLFLREMDHCANRREDLADRFRIASEVARDIWEIVRHAS